MQHQRKHTQHQRNNYYEKGGKLEYVNNYCASIGLIVLHISGIGLVGAGSNCSPNADTESCGMSPVTN